MSAVVRAEICRCAIAAVLVVYIQGIRAWQNANEDEHDQAHAFLPVIGPMGETDAGAGQDQNTPDP